jgi:hypothetical protein
MMDRQRADFNEQCRQYWQRLIASPAWCATNLSTRRPSRQNHLRVDLPDDRVWILIYREMPAQRLSVLGVLVKFDRQPGVALWEQLRVNPPIPVPAGARFSLGRDQARESRNLVLRAKVNDRFASGDEDQFMWFAENAFRLHRFMRTVIGEA